MINLFRLLCSPGPIVLTPWGPLILQLSATVQLTSVALACRHQTAPRVIYRPLKPLASKASFAHRRIFFPVSVLLWSAIDPRIPWIIHVGCAVVRSRSEPVLCPVISRTRYKNNGLSYCVQAVTLAEPEWMVFLFDCLSYCVKPRGNSQNSPARLKLSLFL